MSEKKSRKPLPKRLLIGIGLVAAAVGAYVAGVPQIAGSLVGAAIGQFTRPAAQQVVIEAPAAADPAPSPADAATPIAPGSRGDEAPTVAVPAEGPIVREEAP